MAENTETESTSTHELKHLGLFRMAAIQALICVSNLYEYAKQNSGPLKSTIGTVEGAVTTVLSPVYERFKGVPDDLLVFVDNKVDEATHKLEEHAPPLAKQAVMTTRDLIQEASEKTQKIVGEARRDGSKAALHMATAECKQFLLTNSVKAWVKLNNFTPVHTVADMAVPTAAHWSEKYNDVVKNMSQKGYPLVGYLPLVPVDEIAKAFKQGEAGKKADENENTSSSSDSDSD